MLGLEPLTAQQISTTAHKLTHWEEIVNEAPMVARDLKNERRLVISLLIFCAHSKDQGQI